MPSGVRHPGRSRPDDRIFDPRWPKPRVKSDECDCSLNTEQTHCARFRVPTRPAGRGAPARRNARRTMPAASSRSPGLGGAEPAQRRPVRRTSRCGEHVSPGGSQRSVGSTRERGGPCAAGCAARGDFRCPTSARAGPTGQPTVPSKFPVVNHGCYSDIYKYWLLVRHHRRPCVGPHLAAATSTSGRRRLRAEAIERGPERQAIARVGSGTCGLPHGRLVTGVL